MLSKLPKQSFIILLLALFTQSVAANLLIHPTRVQLNPADRGTEVTLMNTSETTNTYRLEWAEKKALESGGYDDLSAEAAVGLPLASSMIRFSPRQVTLKPGERQVIKLALRRPQNLANGEYRSHLLFKALPSGDPDGKSSITAPNMQINIVLSFAIPVVVAHGPHDAKVSMKDAEFSYSNGEKRGSLSIGVNRSGTHSVIGNVNAYWTPNGGQEQLIAKTADFNLWPEVKTTRIPLTWIGTDFAPTDGKLRIVYEGTKDFRGQVFFDQTINVSRSMIKMAN